MSTVADIFRDIWNTRIERLEEKWKEQRRALTGINARINKLTDKLIETTSSAAVGAYEAKLEKLEAEKALIAESLDQKPDFIRAFDTNFRAAMNLLANP